MLLQALAPLLLTLCYMHNAAAANVVVQWGKDWVPSTTPKRIEVGCQDTVTFVWTPNVNSATYNSSATDNLFSVNYADKEGCLSSYYPLSDPSFGGSVTVGYNTSYGWNCYGCAHYFRAEGACSSKGMYITIVPKACNGTADSAAGSFINYCRGCPTFRNFFTDYSPVCATTSLKTQLTLPHACFSKCIDSTVVSTAPGCCKPQDCTWCGTSYSPVCGKDGVTYFNPCRARCAGTSIASNSACKYPTCKPEARKGSPCTFDVQFDVNLDLIDNYGAASAFIAYKFLKDYATNGIAQTAFIKQYEITSSPDSSSITVTYTAWTQADADFVLANVYFSEACICNQLQPGVLMDYRITAGTCSLPVGCGLKVTCPNSELAQQELGAQVMQQVKALIQSMPLLKENLPALASEVFSSYTLAAFGLA